MSRAVSLNKKMYAIFNGPQGKYVQPCTVTKITKTGFWAECHNGGVSGHEKGEEFFSNDSIGNGVYFSKDSAAVNL